jgi:ribose transport system ATP-binding protein
MGDASLREAGMEEIVSATPPMALRLENITKRFGPISVLEDVSVDFRPGEIHALIGENGAGKSTLGKIAGGFYSRSAGRIEVGGQAMEQWTPAIALQHGVAIMHQELQVVPSMSVAQNVFLGLERTQAGLLMGDEVARVRALMARCGFDLDPKAKARDLGLADQQKIEIMRALARQAKVLVMDEPTSSLTEDEADKLHVIMRQLRDAGATIIYVSHFIDHLLAHSDRVTILRDGRLVRTGPMASESKSSLIAAMLGHTSSAIAYPALPPVTSDAVALRVEGLSAPTGLRNVSFSIRKGEVVGLVGLVGSGRTEIARALYGADPSSGRVVLNDKPFDKRSPRASIARKLVMVPEDRRGQGLFLGRDLTFNVTLPYLRQYLAGLFLSGGRQSKATDGVIGQFRVSPANARAVIGNLSGGNQQKVLLGRWLADDPDVVLLDDPSRGVDVGARQQIHDLIAGLARSGKAVLLISSEIEEVLGMSHRAYLVRNGAIAGEIDPRKESVGSVLHALFSDVPSQKAS